MGKKTQGALVPRPCDKCGTPVIEARNERLQTQWVEMVPKGDGGLALQATLIGPPIVLATSSPSMFKPHLCLKASSLGGAA